MIPNNHRDGLIHSKGQTYAAPVIDNKLGNQQNRVGAGIKDGSITKEEAGELRQDNREFQKMKNDLAADGSLSKEDRAQLRGKLDENSQSIYDLRHN